MNNEELQELVLRLMPQWQHRLAKPFKSLLADGISPKVYHSMLILSESDAPLSMGELGSAMHMTKQQATKVVNRLIEHELGQRSGDNSDRRIVRIELTDKAKAYIESFRILQSEYYGRLFSGMEERDRTDFAEALRTLDRIFKKLPCVCTEKGGEECSKGSHKV